MTEAIIDIANLGKTYSGGFEALKDVNLQIRKGEIFALLGPNGAGKTTLISIVCGLTNPTKGKIRVGGFDIIDQAKEARGLIGLVPQELTNDAFETVINSVSFSRGIFGKKQNPQLIEKILRALSLWEKRNNKTMTLSGGMKRRLMIAKALSHEPQVLFLDEPTAGVDVELRKDMWEQVHELRKSGVTIILTTHYIEEAEDMADRIGIINKGELVLVEDKKSLICKLGSKQLTVELDKPLPNIPDSLKGFDLQTNGKRLIYNYDSRAKDQGVYKFLRSLDAEGIVFSDLNSKQSSLEEIFVELVRRP